MCIVTMRTDDLTLSGSTDILDPVDYGNRFALDGSTVRITNSTLLTHDTSTSRILVYAHSHNCTFA